MTLPCVTLTLEHSMLNCLALTNCTNKVIVIYVFEINLYIFIVIMIMKNELKWSLIFYITVFVFKRAFSLYYLYNIKNNNKRAILLHHFLRF